MIIYLDEQQEGKVEVLGAIWNPLAKPDVLSQELEKFSGILEQRRKEHGDDCLLHNNDFPILLEMARELGCLAAIEVTAQKHNVTIREFVDTNIKDLAKGVFTLHLLTNLHFKLVPIYSLSIKPTLVSWLYKTDLYTQSNKESN